MGSLRDVALHYVDLGRRQPGLWLGLCWTVVTAPEGDTAVLSRLADDRDLVDPLNLTGVAELADAVADQAEPYDACAWVVSVDRHVGLLEVNGFAGSLTPTLAALSSGGEVAVGMYWSEAIGQLQLSYAEQGAVQLTTTLDPELVELSSAANLRGSVLRVLEAASDLGHEACGLAVVEDLTGVRIDDSVLGAAWPAVRFRMRRQPKPATPRNGVGSSDVELAIALDAASAPDLVAAQALLIDAAIELTGLQDQPTVIEVARLLKSGVIPGTRPAALGSLAIRMKPPGKPVWTDLGWRRWKAVQMLSDFCGARSRDRSYPFAFDGWMPAMIAVGEDWPEVRRAALTILVHPDNPA